MSKSFIYNLSDDFSQIFRVRFRHLCTQAGCSRFKYSELTELISMNPRKSKLLPLFWQHRKFYFERLEMFTDKREFLFDIFKWRKRPLMTLCNSSHTDLTDFRPSWGRSAIICRVCAGWSGFEWLTEKQADRRASSAHTQTGDSSHHCRVADVRQQTRQQNGQNGSIHSSVYLLPHVTAQTPDLRKKKKKQTS